MVIKIKNKTLHSKIFKKLDEYDKKAIDYFKKGNMKMGKRYEKLSDNLYAKNYSKIFIVKTK